MSDRVRVGVIGCGLIAQIMHLHYLRELSERFEIAALCDVSPATLDAVGSEYSVLARYSDWREMIAGDLDGVLVLTGESHAEPAIAAANLGKHVFVEKPMCFTLSEADRMIDAADRNGVTLMVGYMKRHDPAYAYFEERLGGAAGLVHVQVTSVQGPLAPFVSHYPLRRFHDVPRELGADMNATRTALFEEALGVRVTDELRRAYHEILLDSAIHELNLVRGLVGDPLRVASARFWDEGRSFVTTLDYGPTLAVTLNFITLADFRGWREDFSFYKQSRALTLSFPSPFLRSEPTKVIVEEHRPPASLRSEVVVSYEEAFKQELLHFHACVTENRAPIVSGLEGRQDVALAVAIARSSITGVPQTFSPSPVTA